MGCYGLYWAELGYIGLYWAVKVVQVIQLIQLIQMIQVVKVVRVVTMISLHDMHSENIWFSGSNYRNKLRCRTDGRRKGWKVENRELRRRIFGQERKESCPPTRIGPSKWLVLCIDSK